MPILTWTEKNSVGVEEIDLQHQRMFSIINDLYDQMVTFKAHEDIDAMLDKLVEYADFHFKTEEKYFDEFNYEEKEVHETIHQAYVDEVKKLMAKKKEGVGVELSYEIFDFLQKWWVGHINFEDKKYTHCFHIHGLK